LAALKNMTSQLIGRFVQASRRATRQAFGAGRLTRYAADVVVPVGTAAEIAVLKALAALFVMEPRLSDPIYVGQRTILRDLFEHLLRQAPESLEGEYRYDFAEAADDAARARVVIDQVAALTDSSALLEYDRLTSSASSQFGHWPT
jgi:dGTPase